MKNVIVEFLIMKIVEVEGLFIKDLRLSLITFRLYYGIGYFLVYRMDSLDSFLSFLFFDSVDDVVNKIFLDFLMDFVI